MKHYGDVSKTNGAEVEPVDVITFGSPCQDLSVAGKRAGIQDGERSNLFFEAVRIIKEMRDATNGEYPKYAVWENVPGAFSSNKGHDFHAVLEALCSVCDDTVSIPKPYDAKRTKLVWNKAGEIVGDNYSIAWRTLDAQYWGVPQRRKRIYLVADFTGGCAGEILFKPDRLHGNPAESGKARQGSTADAVGSVDGSVGECITVFSFDSLSSNSMKSSNPLSGCRAVDVAKCIDTTYPDPSKNQGGVAVVQECLGFDMYNQSSTGDKTRTLKTPVGGDDLPVVCVLNDQGGSSINVESEEISPTLRANSHQHEPVIALQANGIDRADTAGCNGCGWRENESYTLNTVDRHAVCYGIDHVITTGGNCTAQGSCVYEHTQATLKAGGVHAVCYDARGNGETLCFDETQITSPANGNNPQWNEPSHPLASTARPPTVICKKPPRKYIIRRLTPTECARLQGFPTVVTVEVSDITRDELIAVALAAGFIEVNIKTGEVFGTRGPGGIKRDAPILLTGSNVNGYKVYSLHANGIKKQIRANRLVWIAANGAIPNGMVVDHINNDKQDNRIENLQLLTREENSTKAREDGLYLVGDDHPNTKVTESERKTISFLYWHTNIPYRVLAEHYGISDSRAQQIIHEHNWSTLAPYDPADAEFWEDVRKTHAEINGKKYKPVKDIKKWYNKLHTDSAEYKMWGNGIALPNARYVIQGIAEQGAKTLGSLFDGSGGFPLAGALNDILPVWASEVEPYCIAVTKSRFKEVHNGK